MSATSKPLHPQQQQIGAVYAKSILFAAKANNELEEVVAELDSLGEDVLQKQPRLIGVLGSTRVSFAEKSAFIDRIFSGRSTTSLVNFLKVVCRHGRFDCIQAIVSETRRLYNDEIGVVDVSITSSSELESASVDRIVEKLEAAIGKKVNLTALIDEQLLGGLQIRVGDTVFDGSIQAQLERVRKSTVQNSVEKIRAQFDRFASVL